MCGMFDWILKYLPNTLLDPCWNISEQTRKWNVDFQTNQLEINIDLICVDFDVSDYFSRLLIFMRNLFNVCSDRMRNEIDTLFPNNFLLYL